jgi:hypothetical protein
MSVVLLLVTVVLLHRRLSRWFLASFTKVSNCSIICFPNDLCSIIQIEVPVGRGKPPVLVDKDESLDKVKYFTLAKIVQISYTPWCLVSSTCISFKTRQFFWAARVSLILIWCTC